MGTDTAASAIAAGTRLGAVRLTVRDLDRAVAFYTRAIGLEPITGRDDDIVALGAGGHAIVELVGDPDAQPAPRGTSGLFHLAVLVPDRPALAASIGRVVEAGAGFTGASDHLVSEALYLNDPEGNGIEIYRDRPRAEWPRLDGTLQMDTLPLDLHAVLAEAAPGPTPAAVPAGTVLGHVHLRVDALDTARRFYAGVVGFDVMVETYPGALFVAAGGYHHHVGLNTWMSSRPAVPGALGLRHYEIVVPDAAARDGIAARAASAGADGHVDAAGDVMLRDPAGNRVLVRTA